MRPAQRIVVFDLDGTLVHTAPDVIVAINRALADAGHQAIAPALMEPGMSYGARRMIELGLASQSVAADPAALDALTKAMLGHYARRVAVDSTPYPLVREILAELDAQGWAMAVCTNKMESLSRDLLERLGLAGHFKAICGRDTFPVSKPDPGHLIRTVAMAGGDIARAVMVGDSEVDIATAKAAGVPVIAVAHGYSHLDLAALEPTVLIPDFQGFLAALDRLGA